MPPEHNALFIAVGGFNRRARDFGFSKRNLKLIDGDELVELVYKYYDQLDGKYKGMIPLRRVFIPESLTEEVKAKPELEDCRRAARYDHPLHLHRQHLPQPPRRSVLCVEGRYAESG